jgi:hypothetical protein
MGNAITSARPDIIVPSDDLATHHLHEVYDRNRRLGPSGKAICALIERSLGAPESFPIVFVRSKVIEMARAAGICAPRTEVVTRTHDLRKWAAQAGFPMVLKTDGSSGGDGVRVVRTAYEAERTLSVLGAPPLAMRVVKRALVDGDATLIWPCLRRRSPVVNAQAFVPGREATSMVACWQGTLLAGLHFEVLTKSESAGPATVLRLIESKEMHAAAEKMVRRLGLSGLHGFDFLLEAGTGNAHLIEMNPRATQVGHLTLGAGRDLPGALYAAVSGEPLCETPPVTDKDTIALFPKEWIRDSASPYLRSAYHDVPWEAPELVLSCIRSRRQQMTWYTPKAELTASSGSTPRGDFLAGESARAPWATKQSKSRVL